MGSQDIRASLRFPLRDARDILAALDALTVFNVAYLKRHPGAPKLYNANVSYVREARGPNGHRLEDWLPVPLVYQRGEGDCEDLASWRAAELQLQGIPAQAWPVRTKLGWHIVVRLPGGAFEDPSKELGMSDPPQLQALRRSIGRKVRNAARRR